MKDILTRNLRDSFAEIVPALYMTTISEETLIEEQNPPIMGKNVSLNLALIGDLEGTLVMTMGLTTAMRMAAKMMYSDDLEELTAMHESALTESLNMISGTFIAKMSAEINEITGEMFNLDITSPMSVVSQRDVVIWLDPRNTVYKLHFDVIEIGEVDIYIGIKLKN